MRFVSKASMHKWCDLVLEVMDGLANQQGRLVSHKAFGTILMDQNGYITLRVEEVLVRVI
jgi:hypothetical protein